MVNPMESPKPIPIKSHHVPLEPLSGKVMGVSENVVYPEKPNGFHDHYPVF